MHQHLQVQCFIIDNLALNQFYFNTLSFYFYYIFIYLLIDLF